MNYFLAFLLIVTTLSTSVLMGSTPLKEQTNTTVCPDATEKEQIGYNTFMEDVEDSSEETQSNYWTEFQQLELGSPCEKAFSKGWQRAKDEYIQKYGLAEFI